ncbi:MAG: hypothetical protein LH629_10490 [Ignavibacteria bacterium]|nr:hypothetical protein [Ignavibacteria bacterium]
MNYIKSKKTVLLSGIICFLMGAILNYAIEVINRDDVMHAQKLIGMNFTQPEIDSMLPCLMISCKILRI